MHPGVNRIKGLVVLVLLYFLPRTMRSVVLLEYAAMGGTWPCHGGNLTEAIRMPGATGFVRARKKGGERSPPSGVLPRGIELGDAVVPRRDRRGCVVAVYPVLDLFKIVVELGEVRLGEGLLHPGHDLVHQLGGDVLEIVLRKVRHANFLYSSRDC